ncbi:MAG: metallophosphoesterase [Rhodospirillaceae bacterium]|nr:metallophosphoesterase [Rhodospirillaceae bacterium]MCY4311496.1 metallophosphoesterase [Rhodospirillaceae bacterium]
MPTFRFIHSSDLHLGRRFSTYPEDIRGRLVEARHSAIDALAAAARDHEAGDIFIAGDLFDTETPSERVWRQALAAMGAAHELRWWIIPGNHDSLVAEALWKRFADEAPESVRIVDEPAPLEVAPGVSLLPSPVPSRFPGRDLTEWMSDCATPERHLRIGLAHGGVVTFGSEDDGRETIPIDRARTARLDYLALGDWHGFTKIADRTFYSGSPERDRFKHQGRGICLAVTISGRGTIPQIDKVETGRFSWLETELHLTPEQDAAQAFMTALPASGARRRNTLLRVLGSGWIRLPQREALEIAKEHASPEFAHFEFVDKELMTECVAEDLDEIAEGGALRVAAEALYEDARRDGANEFDRRVADAALSRLYGFVRGQAQ